MERTVRLFDIDASARCFEGKVLSCLPCEGGYEVILDQTLFFPEEGGQACDTGRLGGAAVDFVGERDGVIFHRVDKEICEGVLVRGEIDYEERFRKMQSHTAEHIVSGLIWQNFGLHNVGFHLSSDEMTADFDGYLDEEQITFIETLANRAVYECRGVRGYYPTREKLEEMEYRSKLALTENVRIVEIEGVDKCACCAPHVSNTGAIGMIRILSAEKYKGGVRLYMKAGIDALEDSRAEYRQVKHISVAISARHGEVAEGVDRLLSEIGEMKGKMASMKRELTAYKLEKIEYTDGNICLFEEEGDMLSLRNLVNEAKKRCGGICAVFAGTDESGYRYILSSTSADLRARAKEINSAIFGKGGGSSEMIQGSCSATREQIEAYFKKA